MKSKQEINKTIHYNWEIVSFSDIVEISGGTTPDTTNPEYWNGDIPWLTPKDITKNTAIHITKTNRKITQSGLENGPRNLHSIGCVLMTSRAPVGIPVINDIPMAVNQGFIAIDCKNTDNHFLYYWIKNNLEYLKNASNGTTFLELSKSTFKTLKISLPKNIEGQKSTAKILYDLDTKIENLQKQNKILEQIAQTVFKSWFVDYDGITEFEDSEIGKTPKGWKVISMSELIEINPSRNLKKDALAPYLGMTDIPIHSSRISRFYLRMFTSGMKFMNGDTLVARITPSLENGKTAFVDFLQNNEVGWGSTEYIVLRPRNLLPPEYGYCFARSNEFRSHAIANMTGTSGRQRVPENCFDDYKVVNPSIGLVETFGKISKKLFLKIRENGEMCNVLITLRDSLLPKLMSGKIRV